MKTTFNEKLIAYLALLSGLSISAVAVYYSIVGLTAIFAAAVVPIIVMGATLEISKLIATVWLKQNWNICPRTVKAYLIAAIVVLMLITSMGIFGFLSKAHLDQGVPNGEVTAKISIIDEKIKTERDNIDTNKKALQQMDAQVDQILGRTTDDKGATKAVQIRKQQAKERASLQADIAKAQKTVAALNEERAPIASELRKVEAEVGPIKYIAAFFYGATDQTILEKAVTWIIMILIVVFDPLAVILLLASQISFQEFRRREQEVETKVEPVKDHIKINDEDTITKFFVRGKELAKAIDANDGKFPEPEGWHQEWVPDSEAWPERNNEPQYEPDDGPITEEQIEQIKEESGVDQDLEMQTLFEPVPAEEPLGTRTLVSNPDGTIDWTNVNPAREYVEIDGQRMNIKAAKSIYPQSTKMPESYVQNEEQAESSLWKDISQASQITEREYIEHSIDELAASVREGRLDISKVPYEIQDAVKERVNNAS